MERRLKLGKKPVTFDSRTLKLGKYLSSTLVPPVSFSPAQAQPDSVWYPMDSNDTLGDCVEAATAHQITGWTSAVNQNAAVVPSDVQVVAEYQIESPGNDGISMLAHMNRWQSNGLQLGNGTDKIDVFVSLNVQNVSELKAGIYYMGGVMLGVQLPSAIANALDPTMGGTWSVPSSGATGDWAPNPNEGHAILLLSYNENGANLKTWGTTIFATWDWITTYADEGYCSVSSDFFGTNQETPEGFNLQQLEADLQAIPNMGGSSPPPQPTPSLFQQIIQFFEGLFGWL